MAVTATCLDRYLTLATCLLLPKWSSGPHDDNGLSGDLSRTAAAIAGAGYRGVQVYLPHHIDPMRAADLDLYAIGRADTIADLHDFVRRWEGAGVSSVSVHLGTGFETPDDGLRLVEAFVEASSESSIEVLLETHRATITQDPGRTLHYVAEFPELRFTADLAHWYTGVEMTYGGFDWKVQALRPVFERVRMVHGRISSPGCAQETVQPDDDRPFVEHFRQLWSGVFRAVLDSDDRPAVLPFAPELLPPYANYARTVTDSRGVTSEESDRWEQAMMLCELAERWFAAEATMTSNC